MRIQKSQRNVHSNFLENNLLDLLDDIPYAVRRDLWFQTVGAPAHWGIQMRQWLYETYPEKWIRRSGLVASLPRSPNLNPADFFLWYTLKTVVFEEEIQTEQELIQLIHKAVVVITNNMLQNIKASALRRIREYQEVNGDHIENLA
ncbi:hypothetical protein ILUMI_06758 [Ignelater luminosus]|uniref:Uncharacterized protein n=1 Tax=Ignelater luminosus TaxID=2038154 RepID=A0A8K0DA09_IGNLU|nr:hypothetical protein ILUMI_06758 [Ignelater luminosus]